MRAAMRGAVAFLVMTAGPLAPQASAAGAADAAPSSVVITSPSEGSVVTSQVAMTAEASEGTNEVGFAVSTDGGATWISLGSDTTGADGWTATWQSDAYSGAATLRATASDGTSQASDEVSVIADNSPPSVSVQLSRRVFSPNGDGRKDKTVLKASSNEPTELTLEVTGSEGRVRRSWSSSGMTTRLVIEWSGRGATRRLPDGRHTVRAEGVDRVGLRASAATRVVIDTRAPRIRSLRVGPRLFTKSGTLTTDYRLRDRSRDFTVKLQIGDRLGAVGRIRRRSGRAGSILYRTRYPNGEPLYPGLYSARLRVRDDAGNVTVSRKRLWRMHRPVRARVFERLDNVGRRVALTFDDCNYSGAWAEILRTLASFRVKATFFCSGQQVSSDRQIARRTVEEGHAIGSHGWDHALLAGRSQSDIEWRIRADARLWWDIARDTTAPLYRPAYGGYDRNVVAAAGATGHGRVVMWDVDSLDYATSSPSAISGRVMRDVRPGSIVLLHVLDRTADALPAILRGLSRRQLKPVNLHRFFRAAGYR